MRIQDVYLRREGAAWQGLLCHLHHPILTVKAHIGVSCSGAELAIDLARGETLILELLERYHQGTGLGKIPYG